MRSRLQILLLGALPLMPSVQAQPRLSSFQVDASPEPPLPGVDGSLYPGAPNPPLPLNYGRKEAPADPGSQMLEAEVSCGRRGPAPAPRR